jgi:5-(carboxyamino)imidazole ribonucleotide synthase
MGVARAPLPTGTDEGEDSGVSDPSLVAVLGGGQLGRMLALAGIPLGLRFRFLDPSPVATAGGVGELIVAALDDAEALDAVAADAEVVTYEWEGVPAEAARHVEKCHRLLPASTALEITQDRALEKGLCHRLGIGTPQYAIVENRAGLDVAVDHLGVPAVLKTRRGGYDGKGQSVLVSHDDRDRAWTEVGGVPSVLEAVVPFTRELSVLAVRGRTGATASWPVIENHHRGGILRASLAPAPRLTPELQRQADAIATSILDALDFVGVLAVEMFDVDGELLVNELAPRVHNSGHWTIEGAETSQFENHLRAILGWPLGSPDSVALCAMVNCIGAIPAPEEVLAVRNAHLHDYEKAPRPGRKVGHITVTATSTEELDQLLGQLQGLPGTTDPLVTSNPS